MTETMTNRWKSKVLSLRRGDELACPSARAWVREAPDCPDDALRACPRGDWLLWLAEALGIPIPESAYRPAVLRALRRHLAPALEELAGMPEEADALRALPDDATFDALRDAANAVRVGEGRFSSEVGGAALWAYWAAEAAGDATVAAGASAYEAAEAAAEVASDAANASAGRAEHARCAEDVRDVLGAQILEALG